MNNSQKRTFKVAYMKMATVDVEKMMDLNAFGFMLEIKRICQQNKLDPYNFAHIKVAVEILKMQVSFN